MATPFSLLSSVTTTTVLPQNTDPRLSPTTHSATARAHSASTKRELLFNAATILSIASLTQAPAPAKSAALESSGDVSGSVSPAAPPPRKPELPGILNTNSWFQYFGNGFSIRVPPLFEDVMEPEDYNAGLSLYGDKVKPKKYAARFATPDGSEVLSVVIRPTNQLKITFLEARDITDLGSLKSAAKIFVPGGANLYSARTIKIKEDDDVRTYYYYEFGIADQRVAFMAAVISGKAFIAGATALSSKWDEDGAKLRSAAISLSVI